MARICTNKDCQREIAGPGDKCPYCHTPVREIAPEAKPQSAAAPKKTAEPVKPWVAPTREEPKLDLGLIMENAWVSLLVALAAGMVFIWPVMAWQPEDPKGNLCFRWLELALVIMGGFAGMVLVRWRGACRPESRLWRWVERELRVTSTTALVAGGVGFAVGLMVGHGDPDQGLPDAPVWASAVAWIGVFITSVVRMFRKNIPHQLISSTAAPADQVSQSQEENTTESGGSQTQEIPIQQSADWIFGWASHGYSLLPAWIRKTLLTALFAGVCYGIYLICHWEKDPDFIKMQTGSAVSGLCFILYVIVSGINELKLEDYAGTPEWYRNQMHHPCTAWKIGLNILSWIRKLLMTALVIVAVYYFFTDCMVPMAQALWSGKIRIEVE